MSAVLEARGLRRDYATRRGMFSKPLTVKALAGVSFDLQAGRTLAVVGESGSGKSTLARLVTMIEQPTAGTLRIDGVDLGAAGRAARRRLRREVQIVFQNPYGSLNPRQRIGDALQEPLKVNTAMSGPERREAARTMLARVGLRPEHLDRYPHMFSGGQRQRIAIARALMLRPKIVVLDEPVSALDVSIRAQVLNLLDELRQEFRLAYLFISHDLSVVRHFADEVMVIYLGHAVEIGSREAIFSSPQHPYTQALLSAVPIEEPGQRGRKKRIVLEGDVPSPANPPSGCRLRTRCWKAQRICAEEEPPLVDRGHGRPSACHFDEVLKPLADLAGDGDAAVAARAQPA